MHPFTLELTYQEIITRIALSIIIGGMIGYERGHNNRPAGFRTHILVCLGATIVSLTQDFLRINILNLAIAYPETSKVLKTDLGRIGAQVVSGIGFLGAGTIMRDKGFIGGLTTAASIWATGCIGLGIGWGFYQLAIPAGVAILVVLVTLKAVERSIIENKHIVKISISFKEGTRYSDNILDTYETLKRMNIEIKNLKKDKEENKILYTLIMSKQMEPCEIMCELSKSEYVTQIYEI
ncbi:MgtC/SapB family protein [Fusobacterium sp.]|uniref:MgtC/SapB family protein n=1 Tax=Fusobacterium sp. TaxID=68766 RepID=UPI00260CF7ED|nr:MgtC/SapB family protein [Fusobacterium sp.]